MPARVSGSAAAGAMIPFDASVFEGVNTLASDTSFVFVDPGRELELALHEDADPVLPGGVVEYALTYGVHASSAGAPAATVSLPVPSGTTFQSATGGGQLSGGVVTWTLGSLGPGETGEVRARVVADGVSVGEILRAEAFIQDQAAIPNAAVHRTATRVEGARPLILEVIAGPDGARLGETLDLELVVSNGGPSELVGVVLALEYPDRLASIGENLIDGDCPSTTCDPSERMFFAVGDLDPGEAVTYSLPVRVAGSVANGSVLRLEAEAWDATGSVIETGTSFVVEGGRDLELALQSDRDPVAPGDTFTYTLTYGTRANGVGAAGAVLRMDLPTGTSLVGTTGGGTLNGSTLEWLPGPLNPGESGEVTATLLVTGTVGAGDVLVAEAVLEDGASPAGRVRHGETVRVMAPHALILDVSANPDPAVAGETLDVLVTVSNPGPGDRAGVVLTLEYPDGLASLGEGLFDGDCASTTCDPRERVVWNVGSLPEGRGRTVIVPARVAAGQIVGSVVRLEAEVTDASSEVVRAGASFAIAGPRPLDLAVGVSRDPVAPGETFEYTLTYGVLDGSAGAANATLRLPLPQGTSLVSASHGGSVVSGAVEWVLRGLDPGAGGERRAELLLSPSAPLGTLAVSEAVLSRGGVPAELVRFHTATRVEPALPLEVAVTIGQAPALPGERQDLELTVGNRGPGTRSGVVLTLLYPDELASIGETPIDGDCPSTTCDPRERVRFDVGTLAPGESVVYSMPPAVAGSITSGSVVRLDAEVVDAAGAQRRAETGFSVRQGRDLELALLEGHDATESLALLTYTLTYGALDTGVGTGDGWLAFELPRGTRLANASDGGVLGDRMVQWPLGSLPIAVGGERTVTVRVDDDLAPGEIGCARASLVGGSFGELRAAASTRVETAPALVLDVTASPGAVDPGGSLLLDLALTNTTGVDRTSVVVYLELPTGIASFVDSGITGDCPSTTCDPGERIVFAIPLLAAGQTEEFQVPVSIASGTVRGNVLRFDGFAYDAVGASAAASDGVFVGNVFDGAEEGGGWRALDR